MTYVRSLSLERELHLASTEVTCIMYGRLKPKYFPLTQTEIYLKGMLQLIPTVVGTVEAISHVPVVSLKLAKHVRERS